jgi:hypothetical protein
MMKPGIVLTALLLLLASAFDATAGGRRCGKSDYACRGIPPIRGASVSVLKSDECWRGCTTQCGADLQFCRSQAHLSDCVLANDSCTRACLRACRRRGGPFVNFLD